MQINKSPEVRRIYAKRVVDMMEGRREMPAVSYDGNREEHIHASDLDYGLCPLPAYYSRVIPKEQHPPLDVYSALKFLRGRVIERAIAQEEEVMFLDGIACTVDDWLFDSGPVEIKSTASTSHNFSPGSDFPFWISRMKTYCLAHGVERMHLVVIFLVGNMPSFCFWTPKEERKNTGPYQGVDIDAWYVEFTAEELKEHGLYLNLRKEYLEKAIAAKNPIDPAIVEAELPYREKKNGKRAYWQCMGCRWKDVCYYHTEYILGE